MEKKMSSIPLLVTPPQLCSYLADRESQSAFVSPNLTLDTSLYSRLIEHGFRRSGDDVYSPRCSDCSECIACRVPVQQFKPTRSQKRCFKKNKPTTVNVQPALFKQEHYDLYMRYQHHKHPESGMASSSPDEYINFLTSSWCKTCFVEFHINEQLVAVSIVDFLDHSLSAVYTFFDPDFSSYSLGVYAVLWQIEQAQQLELEHVYLGFWIANCQKMAYKAQYHPLEGFINHHWTIV
ncbi:MAG: arginyltransferase [Methylococcales bacterium]|nr:arginyltransferase [Methylococcales bacterium]